MIQVPRWARGLMVFAATALVLAVVIHWRGSSERLRDLTRTDWWGWLPWLLLIVFWVIIVRRFGGGSTGA